MSGLDTLPSLREALESHGLWAKKAFGQHFLLDLNVTRKIARLAQVGEGDHVIEVGPGPGGLTRALLETGARVTAIEKDERFQPLLAEVAEVAPSLTLVFGDALKADEAVIAAGQPAHIVSNLPYNVGTPLLIKWLTGPWTPASMTLMFQREVADRITEGPGDDAYGRLAVIVQAACRAERVLDAPARAFTPPPKVDSAVVRMIPLAEPPDINLDQFGQMVAVAFSQRRKILRHTLGAWMAERGIEADFDLQRRAEEVPVTDYLSLARLAQA